jgi:hypothetical protein
MRKASSHKQETSASEILPEYRFDYSKAKPNRFAKLGASRVVVVLDPDIAEIFRTPESVNTVLRALIMTMPSTGKE